MHLDAYMLYDMLQNSNPCTQNQTGHPSRVRHSSVLIGSTIQWKLELYFLPSNWVCSVMAVVRIETEPHWIWPYRITIFTIKFIFFLNHRFCLFFMSLRWQVFWPMPGGCRKHFWSICIVFPKTCCQFLLRYSACP